MTLLCQACVTSTNHRPSQKTISSRAVVLFPPCMRHAHVWGSTSARQMKQVLFYVGVRVRFLFALRAAAQRARPFAMKIHRERQLKK